MADKPTVKKKEVNEPPYAIVESSGQQFWLQPKRYYDLDRIQAKVDEKITLTNVLLLKNGKEATIGKPYVDGASVELKVLGHRRGQKVIVYKMRPKKKTRRKNGHRQELTRVMVQSISVSTKAKKVETSTPKTPPKETKEKAPTKPKKATNNSPKAS